MLLLAVDRPIIQKGLRTPYWHPIKDVKNNNLKCGRCITQPKWHPIVSIYPILHYEGGFQFVLFSNVDLVVPRKPIHEGIHFMSSHFFQSTIRKEIGKGSFMVTAFRYLKSTHIRIWFPSFFKVMTMGDTHSLVCTLNIMHASNMLLISSWTLAA